MDINYLNIIDYYKLLVPLNLSLEKETFLKRFRSGIEYNPIFKYQYPSIIDIDRVKEMLSNSKSKDPIESSFTSLYMRICNLMQYFVAGDYSKVTSVSGEIFGSVEEIELDCLLDTYSKVASQNGSIPLPIKRYNSNDLKARLEREFVKLGIPEWRVLIEANCISEVSILESERKVVIQKLARFSKSDIDRIVVHELLGHAFQTLNSMESRKYSSLFSSYIGTELNYEGLAVFTEFNLLSQKHIKETIKRYTLFMIANKVAIGANFYEVFRYIYNLTNDDEFSFLASVRSKRGFSDTSIEGCFQKENSYLIGALKVIKLVTENENNYSKIVSGSFPFECINSISLSTLPESQLIKVFSYDNIDYAERLLLSLFNSQ